MSCCQVRVIVTMELQQSYSKVTVRLQSADVGCACSCAHSQSVSCPRALLSISQLQCQHRGERTWQRARMGRRRWGEGRGGGGALTWEAWPANASAACFCSSLMIMLDSRRASRSPAHDTSTFTTCILIQRVLCYAATRQLMVERRPTPYTCLCFQLL